MFFELRRLLSEYKHLEEHPKNIGRLKTGRTLLGIPTPSEVGTNDKKYKHENE